jgi:hypothetical protein
MGTDKFPSQGVFRTAGFMSTDGHGSHTATELTTGGEET